MYRSDGQGSHVCVQRAVALARRDAHAARTMVAPHTTYGIFIYLF